MKGKRKIIGIIPARMGSSRFPGKPLAEIHGMPMIGHVYHRCAMSPMLDEVYVATCDQEIGDYCDSIGAPWVMTKDTHERCSDRTAEAMLKIEDKSGDKVDIVVMIQGDEPMTMPDMIDLATNPLLEDDSVKVSNLMAPIHTVEEHNDPNCPKVVVDRNNNALYFSREPIPSIKKWDGDTIPRFKQVCVIPFTRDYLLEFNALEPTTHEEIESIDMNRVLEHGGKVKMIHEEYVTQAVDTPEDLKKVIEMMTEDELMEKYVK